VGHFEKTQLREKYISRKTKNDLNLIYNEMNSIFEELSESYVIVFD